MLRLRKGLNQAIARGDHKGRPYNIARCRGDPCGRPLRSPALRRRNIECAAIGSINNLGGHARAHHLACARCRRAAGRYPGCIGAVAISVSAIRVSMVLYQRPGRIAVLLLHELGTVPGDHVWDRWDLHPQPQLPGHTAADAALRALKNGLLAGCAASLRLRASTKVITLGGRAQAASSNIARCRGDPCGRPVYAPRAPDRNASCRGPSPGSHRPSGTGRPQGSPLHDPFSLAEASDYPSQPAFFTSP